MERYWQIEKINLKYNVPLHILVCALILGLSPFLVGVANLEKQDTAKVLEMYAALIGIVMLTPIFLPEQSKEIRELAGSKYMKSSSVYLLRFIGNGLILAFFLAIYTAVLRRNHCVFPVVCYFLGTYAEMLFMGGLGIFSYGLCDNLIAGYMLPLFYYIIAMGSGNRFLKLFYPFSMAAGSYTEKYVLVAAGIFLTAGGIALRCRRKCVFQSGFFPGKRNR